MNYSRTIFAAVLSAASISATGWTTGAAASGSQPRAARVTASWPHAGGAWSTHGSVVSYNGTAVTVLLWPGQVHGSTYRIKAAIRLVAWKNSGISENNGFGLLLRARGATDPSESTAGLMAGVGKGYMGCDGVYSQAVVATADTDLESLKTTNARFHPGPGWHVYGVAVHGNVIALSIDGKTLTTVTSSRMRGGTHVGLFSLGSQINVKNFTVSGR